MRVAIVLLVIAALASQALSVDVLRAMKHSLRLRGEDDGAAAALSDLTFEQLVKCVEDKKQGAAASADKKQSAAQSAGSQKPSNAKGSNKATDDEFAPNPEDVSLIELMSPSNVAAVAKFLDIGDGTEVKAAAFAKACDAKFPAAAGQSAAGADKGQKNAKKNKNEDTPAAAPDAASPAASFIEEDPASTEEGRDLNNKKQQAASAADGAAAPPAAAKPKKQQAAGTAANDKGKKDDDTDASKLAKQVCEFARKNGKKATSICKPKSQGAAQTASAATKGDNDKNTKNDKPDQNNNSKNTKK